MCSGAGRLCRCGHLDDDKEYKSRTFMFPFLVTREERGRGEEAGQEEVLARE